MTEELKLKLRQLKSKNNRDKSAYLHLDDVNRHRSRALVTFTVLSMVDKQLQLILIKEIKNHFIKLLRNSSIDVVHYCSIELGKSLSNPHTHLQLYFEEENIDKINKAFQKTLNYFSLDEKRCKLVQENKDFKMNSSFNYVIKEFDNCLLSDSQILAIDKARSSMKKNEAKSIPFFSRSRLPYPHVLYKALFFQHQLSYVNVNYLFKEGFAIRLQGRALLEARNNAQLPCVIFKNGAIRIKTMKLYSLIRLFLCFTVLVKIKILQRSVYYNKSNAFINIEVKKQKLYHKME